MICRLSDWLQDQRTWIQIDYDICRYSLAWFIYQNVICAKTIITHYTFQVKCYDQLCSIACWTTLPTGWTRESTKVLRVEYVKETSAIAPFLVTGRMSEIPSSSIVFICCCVKELFHVHQGVQACNPMHTQCGWVDCHTALQQSTRTYIWHQLIIAY